MPLTLLCKSGCKNKKASKGHTKALGGYVTAFSDVSLSQKPQRIANLPNIKRSCCWAGTQSREGFMNSSGVALRLIFVLKMMHASWPIVCFVGAFGIPANPRFSEETPVHFRKSWGSSFLIYAFSLPIDSKWLLTAGR
jgi:hypothetical protein